MASNSHADNGVPNLLPFQGRLTDASGNVINQTVTVNFQIFPPTGNCYIYEDTQTVTPTEYGLFAVTLGSLGNSTGPSNNFLTVFNNDSSTALQTSCGGTTYTPASGDWRRLQVVVNGTPLPSMQTIAASAYAMNAQLFDGKTTSSFVNILGTVTQANMDTLTAGAGSDASALHNHDSTYARLDGTNSFSGGITAPSSGASVGIGTSTTNADLEIYKKNPSMSLDALSGQGGTSTIEFLSGATQRGAVTSSEASNGLNFYSGTTLSMSINSSGTTSFYNSVSTSGVLGLGNYTSATESTLTAGLTPSNAGAIWYNSSTGAVRLWNGTSATSVDQLDSNGLISAAVIPSTSVVAGSYGSSSQFSTFTVGADGRVTAASSVAIPVTTVAGKTGDVTLNAADIFGLGPVSTYQFGVGTGSNEVVALDGTGHLPAVDGSALTNIHATDLQGVNISTSAPVTDQVLTYNSTSNLWEPRSVPYPVTSVAGKSGIVSLTFSDLVNQAGSYFGYQPNNVACGNGQILGWNTAQGAWLCMDGGSLANVNAVSLQGTALSSVAPTAGQTLTYNQSVSAWQPVTPLLGLTGDVATTGTSGIVQATIQNNAITSSKINSSGVGINRLLITDPSTGTAIDYATCTAQGQTLTYDLTLGWVCTTPLTSIISGTGLIGGTITSFGTLNLDVGVSANQILQLTAQAKIPAVDASLVTNVNASRIATRTVSTNTPAAGQVLSWNVTNSDWEPSSTSALSVVSVSSGTGLVAGVITSSGTINVDVGTAASKILQVTAAGIYPADDGSLISNLNATRIAARTVSTNVPLSGQVLSWNQTNSDWEPSSESALSVVSVSTGIGLVSNTITSSGTINVDVGTAASKILQVTAAGVYPADDGALISNVNASRIGMRTVSTSLPGVGQVLGWNTTNADWEPADVSGLSVVSVSGGTGMVANTITSSGSLSVDVGTAANKILQVTSAGLYPADDGSLVSNVNATRIGTRTISTSAPNAGQVLSWNTTNSDWEPSSSSSLSVVSVASGTGIVANTITSSGTLTVDVGTAANKILQVTSTGLYPADDGSLVSNVNATRIGTRTISTSAPNAGQVLSWNTTNSDWEPSSSSSLSVVSVASGTGLVANTITSSGTLTVDVGTAANKILQVTSTGLYPADDGSLVSNVNATRIGTRTISTSAPNAGQVLSWNTTNSDWEPSSSSSLSVVSVASGTGLVANTITSSGTLTVDVGTAANKILQVTSTGLYPADDGSLISNVNATRIGTRTISTSAPNAGQVLSWNTTNSDWEPSSSSSLSVVSVASGTGLVANTITSSGTLTVDVGTAANKILQVTSAGLYPADDGSLLSNLNASRIGTRTISTSAPGTGQVLSWNTSNSDWEPSNVSGLSVVSVAGGTGLVANTITSSGTLTVDVGTAANKILQVTSAGLYPADDGSLLSNLNASRIGTRTISTSAPGTGQVLSWNTSNSDWEPSNVSGLSVVSVAGGTGLVANTITSSGTLTVDVGTAANKILQVTSTGLYPADDGSLISNLNASRIGTRTISTSTPNAGQVLSWNTTNSDWEPSSASLLSVVSVASGTGLVANTITSSGTLTVDVGTAANKILQVTSAGLYPADDGSLLSNLNASRIGTRTISTSAPGTGQVLSWNTSNSDWEPSNVSGLSVVSVAGGTGLVANTITSSGTLTVDVGTAANKILQVTSTGLYPADDGSLLSNLNASRIGTHTVSTSAPGTGQVLSWNTSNSDWEPSNVSGLSVVSVAGGTGLVANTITSSGTLTVDVGTAANKILQVTSAGLYPADDGSLLSNLNASRIGTRTISTSAPGTGQVLSWNTSNSDWEPSNVSGLSVVSVAGGTGLVANTITSSGTLTVDVGTAANKILQVTSAGLYPADDGSLLSNLNASRIGTRTISTSAPGTGQVLSWNTSNSDWEPSNVSGLSVVSVAGGTGLVANTITSSGTLTVDVGTAANKILQVTSAGLYPADDGSLLSNLNASRIGTRTISTSAPGTGQVLSWNTSNSDWEPSNVSGLSVVSVAGGTGLVANTITSSGTLTVDVGTAANKILQVTSTGLYPADDGSLLSNLNASRIGTRTISTSAPGTGQVLSWNTSNSDWEPSNVSGLSVVSVAGGTGLVANTITSSGTLTVDVGTAANKILQVTSTGLYPADDGSLLSNINASRIGTRTISTSAPGTGQVLSWNTSNSDWEPSNVSGLSVVSVAGGTGLVANTITSTGTLAVDVGTAANKILQVTSTGLYPADDGSLLSNLNASRIGTRTISTSAPGIGQVLSWNTSNSDWEPSNVSGLSVVSVAGGTGLVANTITSSGTLTVDVGTAANKILQVTSTGLYPADDGSLLSNLNASRIGTRTVSTSAPGTGQVLSWNTSNSDWEPSNVSGLSVVSVAGGTGLVANTITSTGTLTVDVGTAANKILQVTSSGLYPADDGSLLSNLNASRIGTRTISTSAPGTGQVLSWNTSNSDWEPSNVSGLSVVSVAGGTGLVANTITSTGTLTVDVGTAANKILQVTSTGLYPADDGSLLSNLNASRIGTRTISTSAPGTGQVLSWNTSNSDWEPSNVSGLSVVSVAGGTGLVANTITSTGTLTVDVGTAANKILQVTSTGLYPADDGSLLSNLNASRIGTRTVSTSAPGMGQVLSWNTSNSDWEPSNVSGLSVVSVAGGTGLVANTITSTGTLTVDVGTAANKILQVTSTGLYPADDGSLLSNLNASRIGTRTISTSAPGTGQVLSWNTSNSDWEPSNVSGLSVVSVAGGTGLVANTITSSGTLTVDVGTAANKILQVTSTGLYPADDGSLLSNLNASRIGTRTISTSAPGTGQVLSWNTSNSDWEPSNVSGLSVVSVAGGTGLVANTITASGTLTVDVGTAANKILQVTSTGLYPADDGSLLSNLNASRIGTRTISTSAPGTGQVLSWNTSNSDWEPSNVSGLSVVSVAGGTGLVANTITSSGTLTVDVGTAANKILQVTSTGLYPADDGSLLSNLNASRIGTRTVSTSAPGTGQVLSWNTSNSDWEPSNVSGLSVVSVAGGTGLVANTITSTGTLTVDVGTAANKILQVTSTGLYPADDGSLLSNLNASRIGTRTISTSAPGTGQVLSWNTSNSDWEPSNVSGLSVVSVAGGTGLVANTITSTGTLTVDVGTAANKILQVTSTGLYPADDGSLLSNLNASRIGTRTISTSAPGTGQVLSWNMSNSDWEPSSVSALSVVSVASGTGLVANTITSTGTLTVDVGTAANKILQVTSAGLYPADDGSLLSNLNASRIGTRTVSTSAPGTGQVLSWNTSNSDWEPSNVSGLSVVSVAGGTGLVANTITSSGTLMVDVGTAANKILQVTSTGLYPADDGSLLSNLNASRIGTRTISTSAPNLGQVLSWNTSNSDWEPSSVSALSVVSVASGTGLVANTITSSGTLTVDVGTAANKILQVTSTGLYPADDGSLLSNLNATRIGTRTISTSAPGTGQVLSWNTSNSDWEPSNVSGLSVVSVAGGTGLVANTITSSGTLTVDVGTAANKILQVTSTGLYPADDGSLLSNLNASRIGTRTISTSAPGTGQVLSWNTSNFDWEPSSVSALSVVSVASGTGLVANTITSTGTLTVDVGTAANKILQVTSTGLYPADDGSLLSNLNASRIGTRTISTSAPGTGQVLSWNTSNSDWEPSNVSGLSVVSVASGTGLVANTITSSGTLTVDVGTAANKILQVTSTGLYPADDGSLLSNLNASRIGTRTISTSAPNLGQVLSWNTSNSDWEPSSVSALSVVSVASGTGLVANTITSTGTLTVDVGTAANKILQVTSTGLYPADDGSLLSNLNASRIGTRTISTSAPGTGQVLSWNTSNSDWEPSNVSGLSVVSVAGGTGLVANTITSSGTLTVDVGTAANKILQVTSTGLYPADDGSLLSNLNASRIGTRTISTSAPNLGQVLSWNTSNSDWEPSNVSGLSVVSVAGGTGLVANTITSSGTLTVDVGTAANKILQVTSTGLYPADDGSLLSNLNASRIGTRTISTSAPGTGQVLSWNTSNSDWEPSNVSALSVVSVASGTGLVANTITSSGTLTVDVGTAANKILQVTSTGLYPADDGSLLSNLNASRIGTRTISTSAPGTGQVLSWNTSNSDWEPSSVSSLSVVSVASGTGLVANTITSTGTLTVDVGTAANKILQVTSTGLYPADDGFLISNLNASRIGTRTISTSAPNLGQVLSWNTSNSDWEPSSVSSLSVVSVASGTGLVANTITSTGTLTVDVGTAANKILQVTSTGLYPADDGSLLSNLNASRIGTRTISTSAPNLGQVLSWNTSNSDWEPSSISTLSVVSVASGTGLVANTITSSGTLTVDVGTAANKILQVTSTGLYPADDGSLLSNLNASRIGTKAVSNTIPTAGQILGWNATNTDWEPILASSYTSGYLPLAGGTMLGNLNMGTFSVLGGTADSGNLYLDSTSSAVKGNVVLAPSGGGVTVGTAATGSAFQVNGGAAIGYSTSTTVTGNGLQVAGNIAIDSTGSTTTTPRTFGFTSFSNGQAARLQIPDGSNGLQNAYGDRVQMFSYWGIELHGNSETSAPSFATGSASDSAVLIYGASGNSAPVLTAVNNAGSSTLFTVSGTGRTGIGTATAQAMLDVYGTGTNSAVLIPRDTTANRPTGINGMIRYNTNTSAFEGFQNNGWVNLIGSASSLPFSSLTGAGAISTIDNTQYAQTWNWSTATTQNPLTMTANTLTTGSALSVTSSSTALNSTNGLLDVANSGTSTSGILARLQSNSTSGSGLTVWNNGSVGIATTTASGLLHISGDGASANNGAISLGAGAFDGSTAGYFGTSSSSSTSGTELAINAATGYAGDLANMEVGGSSVFKVSGAGTVTVKGNVSANNYASPVQSLTYAASVTWNMSSGSNAALTLGGNATLVISNPVAGQTGVLTVTQDATGSRTLTLPASSKVIGGAGGVAYLSTTAGAVDILSFYYDGTSFYWNIGRNYN